MEFIYTKNDLNKASDFVIKNCQSKNYFIKGIVGAGKTTLVKEICFGLRIKDNVNSPTYSLINEYLTDKGNSIFHMDLFRLESKNEVDDLGIMDYFETNNIIIIEWPEVLLNYYKIDHSLVEISYLNDFKRRITITNHM
jgi:tRNA threonylcarbamoyladenosine biosynthesis protein TsaE